MGSILKIEDLLYRFAQSFQLKSIVQETSRPVDQNSECPAYPIGSTDMINTMNTEFRWYKQF